MGDKTSFIASKDNPPEGATSEEWAANLDRRNRRASALIVVAVLLGIVLMVMLSAA